MTVSFSHVGVCVTDLDRSIRFYVDGLGFEAAESWTIGSEYGALMELPDVELTSQFLRREGASIELLHYGSPGAVGPAERRPVNQLGLTHLCFRVDDVDAVAGRLAELGGTVHEHTRTTFPDADGNPQLDFVYCTDPDGTRIELMRLPGLTTDEPDVLTRLDETLRHQLPTTFDHVGTSDPRFYDRYFFCAYDPDRRIALHIGMGLYMNMNVLDGYVTALVPRPGSGDDRAADQHNLRLSRALRPDIDDVRVGPLDIEVIEPFQRARVRCAPGAHAVSLDLEWRATSPPTEEDHHFRRLRGRVTTDYRRYTIVGAVSGTVRLGDETFEADNWFSARDHSWGVREQVAGPEPVTGPPGFGLENVGYVFYWVPFQCGDLAGHVQLQTLGDGTVIYRDGVLYRADGTVQTIVDVELDVDFHPGTRQFSEIRAVWTTASGARLDVVSEPLLRPFSMDGTGYDWGWDDGQGLGVYRGESCTETDVYDLSDPELVVRADGEGRRPMHRETPARVVVDGVEGSGHQILVVTGPVTCLAVS